MDYVTRFQLTAAGDGCIADLHRSMRIAFVLDGWPTTSTDCSRDSAAEHQVIVRCVDDGVDVLLRQVAGDDHDSRRRHCFTSSTRAASWSAVARAMLRSPMSSIVMDAHATPHSRDSSSV